MFPVPGLPKELIHMHIIPRLLSEHIHNYLIHGETPSWHAFYCLPLVCKEFYGTCQSLCKNIFGLEPDEGGAKIIDILGKAKDYWDIANRPILRAWPPPEEEYTFQDLMSSSSLIQVYICAAIAKIYLHLDILYPVEMEKKRRNEEFDYDDFDVTPDKPIDMENGPARYFKMRDDRMHTPFLPLTCAVKLCDRIKWNSVAHLMADHLANIVPLYTTIPLMLKETQDLEQYMAREYRYDTQQYAAWTIQSLGNLKGALNMLRNMQRQSRLVEAYKRNPQVPLKVLEDLDIVEVLRQVASEDWGKDTEVIQDQAGEIAELLLPRSTDHWEEEPWNQ